MQSTCRFYSSTGRQTLYRISKAKSWQFACRYASTRSRLFQVSEEVEDAIHTGRPVVALETTIYTHGYPYPDNVALASHLESLVRVNGGVPATIGVLEGTARVGMDPEELIQLISTAGSKDTWKLSRRDLGFIGGLSGLRGQKLNGGTTISGTMVLAHLAGIKIFATGGLGGVHRGGENSMDISADLTELGRTPVVVISSGCKSFLDIPRTLEYLETQGVGVGTFADGREGKVDFPAFFSRDSGVKSPQTIQNEQDAAAIVHAQFQLPVHSGLLFANPVPTQAAMAREIIDGIIATAVAEAEENKIGGSANTPYILKRIRELSNNASVTANTALIEANVIRGTKVAVELAKLEKADREADLKGAHHIALPGTLPPKSTGPQYASPAAYQTELSPTTTVSAVADLLVIGSLAADTSCDYSPFEATQAQDTPSLHTSNPAIIKQTAGGVGRNVATAAQFAGVQVSLASIVADDIAGKVLLNQLTQAGIDQSNLRVLQNFDGTRTAQYVAVNDANKDMVLAMGDFSIFDHPELDSQTYWSDLVSSQSPKPRWIVLDGNWPSPVMSHIVNAANTNKIPIAFEPVSTVKAARLFDAANTAISGNLVIPDHVISLCTPNKLELDAMHAAAESSRLFESEFWWSAIDSFGLPSSGSRDRFTYLTNRSLVDQGVPQQVIRLLPFIPNIITKLGPQGCLLTMILPRNDPRLTHPDSAPYILSRSSYESGVVGGVYMRLFPPAEMVTQGEIVSVNGVGDTLLGVLMAGIITDTKAGDPPRLEELIPIAQKAAVLTLRSVESVSPAIKDMRRQ